jgi:NAD(P)-dependent dehydrogenase (short-subunit alcohol dehydrogenase family)
MDSLDQLFSLRGHTGLVTGASSGLGWECAYALALGGANLVLVARRGDRIEKLAAELSARYGVSCLPIAADITATDTLDPLFDRANVQLGTIDILINNAGVSPTGRAERFSREVWDDAFALNVTAPMMLAQRFARRLIKENRPGRIVNITSILAYLGSAVYRLSAYTASKAALANLTRQLAIEWAPYNILVNAIAPGWIPTEATELGIAKPEWRERMETFTPMGRLGRPEEVRGAIIFLASAASSYVTGSVVSVDGGYQSW